MQLTQGPGRVVNLDLLCELALEDGRLALERDLEVLLADLDDEVARLAASRHRDRDGYVL